MYSAIKQNKKPKSAISRKRESAETGPFLKPFQIKSVSTTSGGSGKPSNSAYLRGTGQIVQTNLRIGAPNDKYEQEADAVANQVVSASSHALVARPPAIQRWDGKTGVQMQEEEEETLSLQRKCADCGTEEDKSVQRKSPRGSELVAPPDFSSNLSARSGRGQALPDTIRTKMESGFGRDFSNVSIHTDGEASQMSSAIGARAFTHGSDIYFKRGEYNPDSRQGQHLLAHELTHTVQQGAVGELKSEQISSTIQRQSIRNPLYPCVETTRMPGGTAFLGTWVHLLIQQYYVSAIDPMAAAEYMIPGSGGSRGLGRADIVSSSGGIYEIKPVGLMTEGLTEATNYLLHAETTCDPGVPWHLGTVYFPPPYPLILGNVLFTTWLAAPGVIVYSRRTIPTVPVPREVPVLESIRKFIKDVAESGRDAYQAAEEFLRRHPEVLDYIRGIAAGAAILAAVIIVVATILEDIATFGAGIADDPASFAAAYALVRVAMRMI